MKHTKLIKVDDSVHHLVKRIVLEMNQRGEPSMERNVYLEAVKIGVALIAEREVPKNRK